MKWIEPDAGSGRKRLAAATAVGGIGVLEPEAGALRIQVAITKLEESWETLDAVSNILPPMIVISETKKYTTGKPAFVGEAGIEIKVTDAPTRELLFAGVDRRVGGKSLTKPDSWDDVNAIML